jgi:hypothetical protein
LAFFNTPARGSGAAPRPDDGGPQPGADYRSVRVQDARLLASPESGAAVLALLPAGARVRVLGAAADAQSVWVQTDAGQTGWLAVQVLARESGATQGAQSQPIAATLVAPPQPPPTVVDGRAQPAHGSLPLAPKIDATLRAALPLPQPAAAQPPLGAPREADVGALPAQQPNTPTPPSYAAPVQQAVAAPGMPLGIAVNAASGSRAFLVAGLFGVIAAAVMAGSIWLTWVSVFSVKLTLVDASRAAQDWVAVGEVVGVAAAAAIVGLLRLIRVLPVQGARIAFAIVLLAGIGEAIIRYADLHSAMDGNDGLVQLGIGFYVFAAGVALLIVPLIADRRNR